MPSSYERILAKGVPDNAVILHNLWISLASARLSGKTNAGTPWGEGGGDHLARP